MTRIITLLLAILAVLTLGSVAQAQPFSNDSYANLYSWQLGVSGQPMSPQTYLWDRYYYNNPNVSPYLNLNRAQPYGGTDYFTYVQPMEQQRERQMTMSAGGPTRGGYYSAGAGGARGSSSYTSPGASLGPTNYAAGGSGSMIQRSSSFPKRAGTAAEGEIMPYSTNAPDRNASYYYNHYYGGWQGRN
jgi:hypothetical protein